MCLYQPITTSASTGQTILFSWLSHWARSIRGFRTWWLTSQKWKVFTDFSREDCSAVTFKYLEVIVEAVISVTLDCLLILLLKGWKGPYTLLIMKHVITHKMLTWDEKITRLHISHDFPTDALPQMDVLGLNSCRKLQDLWCKSLWLCGFLCRTQS